MAFCLVPALVDKFKAALVDGTIDPQKLNDMSSEERHALFKDMLGDANATKVNALVESKLLLKNQEAGLINAMRTILGENHPATQDITSKIGRMDKILNPAERGQFMSDLASQKLGTHVTYEEAQKITELSKAATDARTALEQNPTDKASQIAYGNTILDMTDYVDSLKPKGSILTFSNIINLPKSALTSVLHFSAMGVQGWGMMTTKPFWEAAGRQFKYFASDQAYRDLQASIIAHPDYPLAKDGKLGITGLGDKLSNREEAIQSSLLEHIPGLGKLVTASSRAFNGFLIDLRFNRFTDLLNAARLRGEDVTKGSQAVKDIANVVNNFTGRGNLGTNDRYAAIQPVLNNFFFSPRKIAATMEMFNPQKYLDPRISPTARIAALRQLSGSLIATASILKLAQISGAKVNMTNPTANDFGKIKIGNSSFGVSGGNETYARLLAKLATNQTTNAKGQTSTLGAKFGAPTRLDEITSYIRGKFSPVVSAIVDAMVGKDQGGQPVTIQSEAYNKLVPIVMQDFINLAKNDPTNTTAWLPSLSAIFGISEESPAPIISKKK